MDNRDLSTEDLIEKYLGRILEGVWVNSDNQTAIKQFLYYCVNVSKTGNMMPYNILIESFNITKGIELARKMTLVAGKILGCQGRQYKEKKFNETILNYKGEETTVAVITDMEQDVPENWKTIFDNLKQHKNIIKIYVKDTENYPRFEKDTYFRWRFLNLHVIKNEMVSTDAYEATLYGLKRKEYDFDEEFDAELKQYIETVYKKSKYKEEEFVDDALLAIEQRVMSELSLTNQLNINHIPPYSKEVNENKDIQDYINDYYLSPDRTYNLFNGQKSANRPDQTRVVVMALSTYPKTCNENQLSFLDDNKTNKDGSYKYFYQMEPVISKLKTELEDGQIDYIITAVTNQTVQTNETKYFESDKKVYEISISPFDFISEIVSKTNLLNADNEKAGLLNDKIKNYITPDSLKSTRKNLRVIPVSVDSKEKIEISISNILNILKKIKNEEKKKLIVEYDNHGGNRDAQIVLESIMSLMENDKDIEINKYTIEGDKNSYTLRDADFGPVKFVSGITEFRKYGKILTLREYYPKNNIAVDENEFVESLEHIASGIQFNDQQIFANGLEDLKTIEVEKLPEGSYLKLFGNEILDDFDFIRENDRLKYTVGMINWCSEKGYYQQCLSIIESVIPSVLAKSKIFNNGIDDDEKLSSVAEKNEAGKRSNEEINTYVFNNVFMNYNYMNIFNSLKKKKGKDSVSIKEIIEEGPKNKNIKNFKKNESFTKKFSINTANPKCVDFLELHRKLKNKRNESNHPHAVEGCSKNYSKDKMELNGIISDIREYIKKLTALPINALEIVYDDKV